MLLLNKLRRYRDYLREKGGDSLGKGEAQLHSPRQQERAVP